MVRVCRLAAAVMAVAVLASACTMKKTDQPPLSGPSELAVSLSLYANPDVIVQDGASQSQVVIQARDQSGQPIKNMPLHMDVVMNVATSSPGKLSAQSVATDSDGRATVTYTAPPPPPGNVDQGTIATIRATPTGTDFSNAVARSVAIRLVTGSGGGTGPVADFKFSPLMPVTNVAVTFDASASRSNVAIDTYIWDFGDGTVLSTTSWQASHIYRIEGTFKVLLRVIDKNGTQSNAKVDTVVVAAGVLPTASFTVTGPTGGLAGMYFFDASASKPGTGGAIITYDWTIMPGNIKLWNSSNVSQPFAAGTYTVSLLVKDASGQSSAAVTKTITVQ